MKKFCLIVCSLLPLQILCQEKEFYSKNDVITDQSKCYYYKIGKYSKEFGWYDSIKSFYCSNNKLRSKEYYDLTTKSGSCAVYYPNGKLKLKTNLKNGYIFGVVTEYFANGNARSTKLYNESTRRPELNIFYLLLNAWDSTGLQTVKNMTGYYNDEYEEGSVKNGLRDSTWITYQDGQKLLIEKYSSGKFITGKRISNGDTIQYDKLDSSAEFIMGIEKLFKFISVNLRYPLSAKRMGVEGKVFVSFIIEPSGELSSFTIAKGISKECNEEAIRVIKLTSPWVPGTQRGRTVRQSYNLPITFELDD